MRIKKLFLLPVFLLPILSVVRGQGDTTQRRGQRQEVTTDQQKLLDEQRRTRELLIQDERALEITQIYDPTNFKAPILKNRGIPTWFEKTAVKGSQYLSRHWMPGVVESTNHRVNTGTNPYVYAYDKMNERLVASRDGVEMIPLCMDTIGSFALADSNTVYLFEKMSFIKPDLFLQPILKSEKGFSLYKRLLTKLEPADFQATAYQSTGRRYDQYDDFCEYYLVYPDHRTYKKIYLHLPSVRKALKAKEADVNEFFRLNGDLLTEESLADLIHTLNSKLTCCSTTLVKLKTCKISNPEFPNPRSRS